MSVIKSQNDSIYHDRDGRVGLIIAFWLYHQNTGCCIEGCSSEHLQAAFPVSLPCLWIRMCCTAAAPSQCVLVTAGACESRAWLGSDTAAASGDLHPVIWMMRGMKPMPLLASHGGLIYGSSTATASSVLLPPGYWWGSSEMVSNYRGRSQQHGDVPGSRSAAGLSTYCPTPPQSQEQRARSFSPNSLHRSCSWCPEAARVLEVEALPPENYSSIF